MRDRQRLQNLNITLQWDEWVDWDAVVRSSIPDKSGVYEAKFKGQEKRLHIGETSRGLKGRVWAFIRSSGHSTGKRIKEDYDKGCIDKNRIEVRWATTHCFDTKLAEAWLQRLHRNDFNGSFPTYDKDPCHRD